MCGKKKTDLFDILMKESFTPIHYLLGVGGEKG